MIGTIWYISQRQSKICKSRSPVTQINQHHPNSINMKNSRIQPLRIPVQNNIHPSPSSGGDDAIGASEIDTYDWHALVDILICRGCGCDRILGW